MKKLLFAVLIFASCQKEKPVLFQDGEGNDIPIEAVRALVRDQFVILPAEESALVSKYFNSSPMRDHYGNNVKYDMPEEMPIADAGDQLEVLKRDTTGNTITIFIQFKH